MEFFAELKFNCDEIKNNLMDITVYIDNISYEVLLNMPVQDRDLLVRSYNKKMKKQQSN